MKYQRKGRRLKHYKSQTLGFWQKDSRQPRGNAERAAARREEKK